MTTKCNSCAPQILPTANANRNMPPRTRFYPSTAVKRNGLNSVLNPVSRRGVASPVTMYATGSTPVTNPATPNSSASSGTTNATTSTTSTTSTPNASVPSATTSSGVASGSRFQRFRNRLPSRPALSSFSPKAIRAKLPTFKSPNLSMPSARTWFSMFMAVGVMSAIYYAMPSGTISRTASKVRGWASGGAQSTASSFESWWNSMNHTDEADSVAAPSVWIDSSGMDPNIIHVSSGQSLTVMNGDNTARKFWFVGSQDDGGWSCSRERTCTVDASSQTTTIVPNGASQIWSQQEPWSWVFGPLPIIGEISS